MIKKIIFNEVTDYFKEVFKTDFNNLNNPFNHIYGYFDKELIGLISFNLIYEKCELEYICVVDEYRKKGIASKLIEKMIYEANKCENISLEVNKKNTNAINLYKKYNFKIVTERKKYYKNEDAYLMVKELGDKE